jgi:hypothetical protein
VGVGVSRDPLGACAFRAPAPLALGRLLVGCVALSGLMVVQRAALPPRRDLPAIVACGVLWFGIYNVARYASEGLIDAGTAAMLLDKSTTSSRRSRAATGATCGAAKASGSKSGWRRTRSRTWSSMWPRKWDVALMVSRGQSSATFLHAAAKAAEAAYEHDGTRTVVYALTDYDAGGDRAAKAIEQELPEYAPGVPISLERLAVTPAQIAAWNLPSRPPKPKNPEAAKWGGKPCVELDAIDPTRLMALVEDAIKRHVDRRQWEIEQAVEAGERQGAARASTAMVSDDPVPGLCPGVLQRDRRRVVRAGHSTVPGIGRDRASCFPR